MPTHSSQEGIHSILHIAKLTDGAGIENHLRILLLGLKARGLAVSLLILTESTSTTDNFAAQMIALGVPTSQRPIRGDVDPGLFRQLLTVLRGNFDAVHTHLIHADVHGIAAARRAGIAHIFTTGHHAEPMRRLPIRLSQRWLWRRVTRGIAVSEAIRQFQIKVEGAPPDRVITIYDGLDAREIQIGDGARAMVRHELGLPPQAPIAGTVCRLSEPTGISDGLRAFWQVSREVPAAHYVIVGDGVQRAALQAEATSYGIAHRVHFLPAREDTQMLMAAFDALIVPARGEGDGSALLEAMAARIPIVATQIGVAAEIVVDGETGYLTPPGDNQAMVQAMLDLFGYPARAHELGEAGRTRLETTFSVQQMIDATLAVYDGG